MLVGRAPLAIGVILVMAFVLLLLVFRSLAIALASILMNLVTVGAAFGFATLVFQHGIGTSFIGIEHQGFVDAWAPLFFFALLFGLSMDYQLFLLAAIRERYEATGDTHRAIKEGIARTGRPITNAALIMIVVFIAFGVTGPIPPTELGLDTRDRGAPRRYGRAGAARARDHGTARRAQLVSPPLAGPGPARREVRPLTPHHGGAPPAGPRDPTPIRGDEEPAATSTSRRRQILRFGLGSVVAALALWAAVTAAGGMREAAGALHDTDPWWVGVAVACEALVVSPLGATVPTARRPGRGADGHRPRSASRWSRTGSAC